MKKTCICSEPEHCDGSCYNSKTTPTNNQRDGEKDISPSNEEVLNMHLRGFPLSAEVKYAVLSAMNEFASISVLEWQKGEDEDEDAMEQRLLAHDAGISQSDFNRQQKPEALPVEPVGVFDHERFWNDHKRTFTGVFAGDFIDREDFEKALHIYAIELKQKQQVQALPAELDSFPEWLDKEIEMEKATKDSWLTDYSYIHAKGVQWAYKRVKEKYLLTRQPKALAVEEVPEGHFIPEDFYTYLEDRIGSKERGAFLAGAREVLFRMQRENKMWEEAANKAIEDKDQELSFLRTQLSEALKDRDSWKSEADKKYDGYKFKKKEEKE